TTPEPTALTDAYSMIKLLVKNRENIPIKIVMNRCRSEKQGERALQQFDQVIHRFLAIQVHRLEVLLEDKAVSQSIMKQSPYVLSNRKTKIAKGMQKLTTSYLSAKKFHTRSHRFIQRLKLFWKEYGD